MVQEKKEFENCHLKYSVSNLSGQFVALPSFFENKIYLEIIFVILLSVLCLYPINDCLQLFKSDQLLPFIRSVAPVVNCFVRALKLYSLQGFFRCFLRYHISKLSILCMYSYFRLLLILYVYSLQQTHHSSFP